MPRTFIVNELAPHIKAFDSYPGIALDAGQLRAQPGLERRRPPGLIAVEDEDPERYKWGLGAPETELWMDNWCILAEAENVDAAYDCINFILDPTSRSRTSSSTATTPASRASRRRRTADLPYLDMIFFDEAQVATFEAGAVNSATETSRSRSTTRPRRRPEPSAAGGDQGRMTGGA